MKWILLLILPAVAIISCNPDPETPLIEYSVDNPVFPNFDDTTFTGQFVITNNGNIAGSEVILWEVLFSADDVYDTGDTILGNGSIANITPQSGSGTIQFTGEWPIIQGSNTYYFIIQISADDDEITANNRVISAAKTVDVVLIEDFETDLTAWTSTGLGTYANTIVGINEVASGVPASGSTKCWKMEKSSADNGQDNLYISFSNLSAKYIGYHIAVGDLTLSSGALSAMGNNFNNFASSDFIPNANPSLNYIRLGAGTQTQTYDDLTWYHIEIRNIDWIDETFDFYIDGTQHAAEFSFSKLEFKFNAALLL